MTAADDDARPFASAPRGGTSRGSRRRDAGAVLEVCPLLESADGAWRSAYASREHRCWAVRPPAQLALAKQRQLCLVGAHAGCATYVAARADAQHRGSGGPEADPAGAGSTLWPPVRSTPLALEPSRGRTGPLPVGSARAGGQTLLVALMVLAFLVLVIARTSTPSAEDPSASLDALGGGAGTPPSIGTASTQPLVSTPPPASPAEGSTAAPTPAVSPAISPQPSATSSPSQPPPASATPVPPAASASASPPPSVARTYRVRSGDTLYSIAARFGVTRQAIADANGITNPSLIRVGQVLVIP